MNRRTFLASSLAVGAMAASMTGGKRTAIARSLKKVNFKLKYAPHFGMFEAHAGGDAVEQLKFMADVGFTALEDNGMMGQPREEQEKIAKAMSELDMTMGVFVAYGEFRERTFVVGHKTMRQMLIKRMEAAVEVAKRVNARWCTVVPGAYDNGLEWDYQTANCIENLKYCAEVCEPAGLVMVLEPLNAWRDHPGLFLTKIAQAYQICKAVGSPSCKILDDLYHQQITEGNLIPNIEMAWDEIAYFQVGDNPGRKEPTTGEINYKNIFKHLYNKGYKGIVGMEHGKSKPGKEGEEALIGAYRECDSF
jgi:hydroxypyruvate isomerase